MVVLAILIQSEPFQCLIEAAAIEIIKLQETPKEYLSVSDEIMLNTTTSGWDTCQEYAISFWVKKINWPAGWHVLLRLGNVVS